LCILNFMSTMECFPFNPFTHFGLLMWWGGNILNFKIKIHLIIEISQRTWTFPRSKEFWVVIGLVTISKFLKKYVLVM
jgi:hypothetical protein